MKLNVLIPSLLAILRLSGCNKIDFGSNDPNQTANIVTTPVSSERFRFFRDNKFGYIDRNGQIVIPARFEDARDFSEGLASIKIGDKYGCIDSSGKVVIPARFNYIAKFKHGLARITLDRLEKGKIDKTGKIVTALFSPMPTPLGYDNRNPTLARDVLTLIERDGKYGYEDGSRKVVIPVQFDFAANRFVEDMAWVEVKNRIGYINNKGKTIVSPQFDYLGGDGTGDFDGGWARVCLKEKCGYIDKTGKIVIPLKFDDAAQKFKDGLAWVKIGDRLGYIDKTGKVVIPARYSFPTKLKAGMEGEVGFCGNERCFVVASNFDRGLAFVEMPTRKCEFLGTSRILIKDICNSYGYIDRSGKLVFKF
jgi:bifunctional DNA-binding transcriptional regulator/antitoxin component of YhaV-PrlF toxin-antitoxin module